MITSHQDDLRRRYFLAESKVITWRTRLANIGNFERLNISSTAEWSAGETLTGWLMACLLCLTSALVRKKKPAAAGRAQVKVVGQPSWRKTRWVKFITKDSPAQSKHSRDAGRTLWCWHFACKLQGRNLCSANVRREGWLLTFSAGWLREGKKKKNQTRTSGWEIFSVCCVWKWCETLPRRSKARLVVPGRKMCLYIWPV